MKEAGTFGAVELPPLRQICGFESFNLGRRLPAPMCEIAAQGRDTLN